MVAETLVVTKAEMPTEKVAAGEELIMRLDKFNFPVVAALWYYFPELNQWRLLIASPVVDKDGPKKAYKAIQIALNKKPNRIRSISLQEISVVSPNEPDMSSMRSAMRTQKGGFPKVRLQGIMLNNVIVEDAFIYRL